MAGAATTGENARSAAGHPGSHHLKVLGQPGENAPVLGVLPLDQSNSHPDVTTGDRHLEIRRAGINQDSSRSD